MSGATGQLLAIDTVPDGRETYMSPLVVDLNGDGQQSVIFGTGGELRGGHLYIATLDQLLENDLSNSVSLLNKEGHGFIAPPTITDITDDGILDIIVNWHGGEIIAIDGRNYQIVWSIKLPGTELNCSPTPGDVNGDGTPDFFASFSQGSWPKNTNTIQVIADGIDGSILYLDTLGCTGFSTALSYDLNNDGSVEFLWNVNEYNCQGFFPGVSMYRMLVLDYRNDQLWEWIPQVNAKNVASTPWLGDVDDNGTLDLILCMQSNFGDIGSFYGIEMVRMNLEANASQIRRWSSYLGSNYDGIY